MSIIGKKHISIALNRVLATESSFNSDSESSDYFKTENIVEKLFDNAYDTPDDIRLMREIGSILTKSDRSASELTTLGTFFARYKFFRELK